MDKNKIYGVIMSQTKETIWESIGKVNADLKAGEPENIQHMKIGGKVFFGYKPYEIFDLMNRHFGSKWGYEYTEGAARVWLKDAEGDLLSREHFGDYPEGGKGEKGRCTDAIGKALSMFSVGIRAYQGLLGAEYQIHFPDQYNQLMGDTNGKPSQWQHLMSLYENLRKLAPKYADEYRSWYAKMSGTPWDKAVYSKPKYKTIGVEKLNALIKRVSK